MLQWEELSDNDMTNIKLYINVNKCNSFFDSC